MAIEPQPFTRTDDLPTPREPLGHLRLRFTGDAHDKDHPIHDISASAMAGSALFLAGDEAHCVERLVPGADGELTSHTRFALKDFLDLQNPDEEMDIEGLAVADDWLWITGSHSRTRFDPRSEGDDPETIELAKLADLKDTRPRCLLARIPLTYDDGDCAVPVKKDGKRRAGLVAQKKDHGSKLGRYLAKDRLLGPSTRMAAKEGGLDIEGIAAVGPERIALGLRGPVIQTYAVLLEPRIAPKKKGKLHLPGAPLQRLVDLGGLGIRDLLADGDDLLILAGPTQNLDGRCAIYRWTNWANEEPENEDIVRLHNPDRLFDLPVKLEADHPEGIEFWKDEDGERRLLVFYDSPNPDRLDLDEGTILADLFALD